MNNIVGSRMKTSKFWTSQWSAIKKNLVLTQKQKSLIIGSLLGDGTMRVGHDAYNANFKVEQGLQQKDFVFWKYEILKPWVFTPPKLSYRYDSTGARYKKSWWFRTVRHPLLTSIYNQFYTNKVKIVPKKIDSQLNELGIACWIMDDGSYSKSKIIDISTYSFTLKEVKKLLDVISNRFFIQGKYYRDRDKGFRIYFSKNETKKLISLIEPHIIDSMRYKIGYSS